jgi:arylsulfatase A-like enzyme
MSGRLHNEVASSRLAGKPVSWLRAGLLAAGIGALLLAASSFPVLRHFFFGLGGGAVLKSVTSQADIALPLLVRVATYIGTAVLLHGALGVAATLLAWCTIKAFPSQGPARLKLVFLWIAVLFAWVLVTNAAWYPRSELGEPYANLVASQIGSVTLSQLVSWALGASVVTVVAFAVIRTFMQNLGSSGWRMPWARRVAFISVIVVSAVALSIFVREPAAAARSDVARPHVIIIGADSLRLDMLRAFGGGGDTPALDALLTTAHVFRDTTTPLARTFPSWMSILTGRHPRSTSAVFNLVGRSTVTPGDTLADVLQERGYRTVFATDEVRFSNIDESYGFDQRVTPVIGASDFVLGSIADIPLLNLINGSWAGRYLLPDTHANRAAAVTYLPEHFSRRLAAEVSFAEPTFLAVHFSASHWPYYVANTPRVKPLGRQSLTQYVEYCESVRVVDAQIGQFVESLGKRGVLDNAIVVVLSDHGEAMSRPGDTLIPPMGDGRGDRRLAVSQWGHGTSVLSPSQYQVLLAFAGFGSAATKVAAGTSSFPASLEDVTPTVLELLETGTAGQAFDGRSLHQELAGAPAPAGLETRIRFTETDFNLPRVLAGDFNVKWLAEAAIDYYRVNPSSGWVEIRPERVRPMMGYKERAAIQGEWLLAALPGLNGATLYGLVNRNSGVARVLEAAPAPGASDPAAVLFHALQQRFPGELGQLTTGATLAEANAKSQAAIEPSPGHNTQNSST